MRLRPHPLLAIPVLLAAVLTACDPGAEGGSPDRPDHDGHGHGHGHGHAAPRTTGAGEHAHGTGTDHAHGAAGHANPRTRKAVLPRHGGSILVLTSPVARVRPAMPGVLGGREGESRAHVEWTIDPDAGVLLIHGYDADGEPAPIEGGSVRVRFTIGDEAFEVVLGPTRSAGGGPGPYRAEDPELLGAVLFDATILSIRIRGSVYANIDFRDP